MGNLADLFFQHCLISSIVTQEDFEKAKAGDERHQSILRALLANAVFYCSLEEANLSLWSNERSCDSIQEVSALHSSASRRSMISREADDQQMENNLPTYLLLAASGLKTSLTHQVLSDLSVASISIRRLGMYVTPASTVSSQTPSSLAPSSIDQRKRVFWAFIVLDRQVQIQLSIYPPLLPDSFISVPLTREKTSVMSISSTVLNPSLREQACVLVCQAPQLLGQIVGRQQAVEAPDSSQDENWSVKSKLGIMQ